MIKRRGRDENVWESLELIKKNILVSELVRHFSNLGSVLGVSEREKQDLGGLLELVILI